MGLINFISQWIKTVVMIFIVISILEIVIPNSNLKKYVNMFIGFLIIIVVVTPIVKLLDRHYDIEKEIFRNIVEEIEIQNYDNEKILLVQENQIKELYINKIKADVSQILKEVTDYDISTINISIYEDDINFGNIKDVEIVLKDKKNENIEGDDSIKVINIEEISLKNQEKNEDLSLTAEKEKIIEYLHDRYKVSKDNIKVFINTMGEGEKGGKSN
ncbi:MAG: stage III sporulation protein AF [Tissierellia bacterium]|nr:stage III sporulation protein AF [Tissierellia bacterium]